MSIDTYALENVLKENASIKFVWLFPGSCLTKIRDDNMYAEYIIS